MSSLAALAVRRGGLGVGERDLDLGEPLALDDVPDLPRGAFLRADESRTATPIESRVAEDRRGWDVGSCVSSESADAGSI